MGKLTHINERGEAHMVDVSAKGVTERVARAGATITMLPETLALILDGNAKKGDVLGVARSAAMMLVRCRRSETLMSISISGDANRSLSIGTRLWPPARIFASPLPAWRRAMASSTVVGAS